MPLSTRIAFLGYPAPKKNLAVPCAAPAVRAYGQRGLGLLLQPTAALEVTNTRGMGGREFRQKSMGFPISITPSVRRPLETWGSCAKHPWPRVPCGHQCRPFPGNRAPEEIWRMPCPSVLEFEIAAVGQSSRPRPGITRATRRVLEGCCHLLRHSGRSGRRGHVLRGERGTVHDKSAKLASTGHLEYISLNETLEGQNRRKA